MSARSSEVRPDVARRKWIWTTVRFVVGIALGGVALWAVSGRTGELAGASAELSHLDAGWLILGIAVEVLSLVAFALMYQRLLRCGGVRAGAALADGDLLCGRGDRELIAGGAGGLERIRLPAISGGWVRRRRSQFGHCWRRLCSLLSGWRCWRLPGS